MVEMIPAEIMNLSQIVTSSLIKRMPVIKIFFLRGRKVMLDKDFAALYGVETKALNRAFKRNIDRFPEDFAFQLTKDEFENLRFHFGASSWGGQRYLPMPLQRMVWRCSPVF